MQLSESESRSRFTGARAATLATADAGAAARAGEEPAAARRVDAVLCAEVAATTWGLSVLASGVADNAAAVTRFVAVSRPGRLPERTGADKTTLVAHLAPVPTT